MMIDSKHDSPRMSTSYISFYQWYEDVAAASGVGGNV
jgi:hypothetical protein